MCGKNNSGQLGNSHTQSEPTPVMVMSTQKVVDVSCGDRHTLIVDKFGRLFATGSNQQD
jgi:alpha-tubulin suppressor-like RCC1 family protein